MLLEAKREVPQTLPVVFSEFQTLNINSTKIQIYEKKPDGIGL